MNGQPGRKREGATAQALQAVGDFNFPSDDFTAEVNDMLSAHHHSLSQPASHSAQMTPESILSDAPFNGYNLYDPNLTDQFLNAQFGPMLTLEDPTFDLNNPAMVMPRPQRAEESQITNKPQGQELAQQSGPNTIFPSIEVPTSQPAGASQKSSPSHLSRSQESPVTVCSASSRQMISPVVRVESFDDETSQDLSTATSKRGQPSRKSNMHLSPYSAKREESEDEDDESINTAQAASAPGIQRQDDGSWTSQSGLSPQARFQIRDMEVPTLDELQEMRQLAEKKAEVEDWLDHSEVGSEGGARAPRLTGRGKWVGRPRARSTNDVGYFNETVVPTVGVVPGPGAYLEVPSDGEEEDELLSDSEPQSPPAEIEIATANPYVPPDESLKSGPIPWVDPPGQSCSKEKRYQPETSNAAMMRFRQRAKDVESASLAATLGSSKSRRRSESDMESVLTAQGISREITPTERHGKPKHSRTGSFFGNIKSNLPGRSNSNQRKRKGTLSASQQNDATTGATTPKESQPQVVGVKRISSWGKPKSPKLDTSPQTLNAPPADGNTLSVLSPSTPWGMAKSVIRRKSRSDMTRNRSKTETARPSGLGDLLTQHGGPPMPKLASPVNAQGLSAVSTPYVGMDADDDSGDELGALQGGIVMDLNVRLDPVIPTHAGFKTQARQLNPRIPEFLLERVTQEQVKRHQRLVSAKAKHRTSTQNRKCAAGEFCLALGGTSKPLEPKAGNKDSENPFIGFQIMPPGTSAEKLEKESDGTIIAAQFPSGVPLPPVERLPAEFECPLCFKVKKFYKPSDWTKHVHEDVQPFTCTFPHCSEPKSFKRKADWVRHENERHRQLENWTCDIGECVHTCYRKDNFVQHLVREHKIPEPKLRNARSANSRSPNTPLEPQGWDNSFGAPGMSGGDVIWPIVDRCRRDTPKQPHDEPCRFCGNICNTWKKLTVHLAKHMEQISMPILPLVNQKQIAAERTPPSINISQARANAGPVLSDSPQDIRSFLTDEPAPLDLGVLTLGQSYPSLAPEIAVNGVAAPAIHTYPPPQYIMQRLQQQPQQSFASAATPNMNYPIQSYPSPFAHSRSPSSSSHTPIPTPSTNTHYGFPATTASAHGLPQQFPIMGQQQMYSSPVDSTSFSDDALSTMGTMDASLLMHEGDGGSNPHTPLPNGGLNIQTPSMQGQFEQSFQYMPHGQGYHFGASQPYARP